MLFSSLFAKLRVVHVALAAPALKHIDGVVVVGDKASAGDHKVVSGTFISVRWFRFFWFFSFLR